MCDTYRVTTADGKARAFWEHNLRFSLRPTRVPTVSKKGAPALIGAGMMGDRACSIASKKAAKYKLSGGRR
jgi:cytochrome c